MKNITTIINEHKEKHDGKLQVDLACGSSKHLDYLGVDVSDETDADIIWDLHIYPWPFEDNSVDKIHCSHYIEHIPHDTAVKEALHEATTFEEFKQLYNEKSKQDGLIKFFNELYRILKPEGKVSIHVPYYTSDRAYGDPSHTRSICDKTFIYLNRGWIEANRLTHYGINANFDIEYSYRVNDEMALRAEVVRNRMIKECWNAVDDLMVILTKR